MKLALDAALKVRKTFAKFDFVQERNDAGYTVNASECQFIQNGGGMCRDFVYNQTKMLKNMRTSYDYDSMLFLPLKDNGEWDDTLHMHSFTVIYGNDGSVYVPESTLDALKGTWYFPTLSDCISAVRTAMGFSVDQPFEIYIYVGDDDNLVGRNRQQTVDYIKMNSTLLPKDEYRGGVIYEGLCVGG